MPGYYQIHLYVYSTHLHRGVVPDDLHVPTRTDLRVPAPPEMLVLHCRRGYDGEVVCWLEEDGGQEIRMQVLQ